MVQYIVYRAWLLTTCEEKDQLVCLFRLLYAIMLAVWRERDVEMGCWESPGRHTAATLMSAYVLCWQPPRGNEERCFLTYHAYIAGLLRLMTAL